MSENDQDQALSIADIEAMAVPDEAFVKNEGRILSEVGKDAVSVFRILMDNTRFRILTMLKESGESNVTELKNILGMSQPAVSHHLKVLKTAGIIDARREGKKMYYFILPSATERIAKVLERLEYVLSEDEEQADASAFNAGEKFLEHGDVRRMFHAIAEETRLRAVELIRKRGAESVTVMCRAFGETQPCMSHHLGVMMNDGILESRRDGKFNFYTILPSAKQKMRPIIEHFKKLFAVTA